MAAGNLRFRRFGMPFVYEPRARIAATARACRAIVATRLLEPPREHEALRALQFAWFTTTLVLDEDADIARALERVSDLDVQAVVAAIDDERTVAAYEEDKRETRSARGQPHGVSGQGAPDGRAGALFGPFARVRERRCVASRRAGFRRSRPTTC